MRDDVRSNLHIYIKHNIIIFYIPHTHFNNNKMCYDKAKQL